MLLPIDQSRTVQCVPPDGRSSETDNRTPIARTTAEGEALVGTRADNDEGSSHSWLKTDGAPCQLAASNSPRPYGFESWR